MTQSTARRRGHGENAIYFDAAKNRYVGAVSLGFSPDGKRKRRKVTGNTKQEVRDKLKALHAELDRGLRTSAAYSVQKEVDDWLEGGLPGRAVGSHPVGVQGSPDALMGQIGAKPLRELTAGDVRTGLEALSDGLSTRYLQIAKASLARVNSVRRGARSCRAERGDARRSAYGCGRAAEPVTAAGAVVRASRRR